jgi:ureidoglycolate lyase
MPSPIKSPSRKVSIEPLTPEAFAPYGSLIQNPASSGGAKEVVTANQGSAMKYPDISDLANYYHLAQSRRPARLTMSMFVCAPRSLRKSARSEPSGLFDVKILERHPYTTQTFIPLGVPRNDKEPLSAQRYLVIVAPTLPGPASRKDVESRPKPYPTPDPKPKRNLFDIFSRARPSPFTNDHAPPTQLVPENPKARLPRGPGLPDLDKVRAFVATGDQAITYGAGTWHSPMAVIGERAIEFVVVQNINGVSLEDCQEVELVNDDEGLTVVIDQSRSYSAPEKAKL